MSTPRRISVVAEPAGLLWWARMIASLSRATAELCGKFTAAAAGAEPPEKIVASRVRSAPSIIRFKRSRSSWFENGIFFELL